jgi:hypothetical protein
MHSSLGGPRAATGFQLRLGRWTWAVSIIFFASGHGRPSASLRGLTEGHGWSWAFPRCMFRRVGHVRPLGFDLLFDGGPQAAACLDSFFVGHPRAVPRLRVAVWRAAMRQSSGPRSVPSDWATGGPSARVPAGGAARLDSGPPGSIRGSAGGHGWPSALDLPSKGGPWVAIVLAWSFGGGAQAALDFALRCDGWPWVGHGSPLASHPSPVILNHENYRIRSA